MKRIFFQEVQRFNFFWTWGILLLAFGVIAGAIFSVQSSPKTALSNLELFALLLGGIAPAVLFLLMRMETQIDESGIAYRLFPLQIKMRKISWEEIESAEVRMYKPVWEYGGWGLRFGFNNGRAVNVRGNTGLQLTLTNGKKLLLGTSKPEELAALLEKHNFS